jgi:hypothetical protein
MENNKNKTGTIPDVKDKSFKQDAILTEEIEIDSDGKKVVVQRARNADGEVAALPDEEERTWNDNESLSRGVASEKEAMKTVENEDLNSDITSKRYPASHPDNHTDRGNMSKDE